MINNHYESQGERFRSASFKPLEMRPAAAKRDFTQIGVRRQLKGLGCNQYEIGIFNRTQEKMLIRTWSVDQVIQHLSWLKRKNAKGADIFCRPGGSENQGIILLDDLNSFQVQQMENQGLKAAVVVETSPQNFQAWIRISETPLSKEIATQVAKRLAKEFSADPNSADWRHFGRLAGFTNRKPQHVDSNGMYPWILLHSYWGKIASRGEIAVEEAVKHPICQQGMVISNGNQLLSSSVVEVFRNLFQEMEKRYGARSDFSRIDWAVIKIMMQRGYSPQDIAFGLLHGSPNIKERKGRHIDDYVSRTITKALRST